MITFTFDDGYLSAYERAYPILRQFGMVGTVGVVCDRLLWNGSDPSDWAPEAAAFMRLAELRSLAAEGWEVASHSLFHRHLPFLPLAYDDEIVDWRYDAGSGSFFARYPWEEITTVVYKDRFLPQLASMEELRLAEAGFVHLKDAERVCARTGDAGTANVGLRLGSAEREIAQSRAVLQQQGFEVRSFIVPYSMWPPHLHQLGASYYPYIGWVTGGVNNGASTTLRRFSVTQDQSVDDVVSRMEDHARRRSWCILCFHEIADTADTMYTWKTGDFYRLVEWISAAQLPVRPLSAGADLLAQGGFDTGRASPFNAVTR